MNYKDMQKKTPQGIIRIHENKFSTGEKDGTVHIGHPRENNNTVCHASRHVFSVRWGYLKEVNCVYCLEKETSC